MDAGDRARAPSRVTLEEPRPVRAFTWLSRRGGAGGLQAHRRRPMSTAVRPARSSAIPPPERPTPTWGIAGVTDTAATPPAATNTVTTGLTLGPKFESPP